MSEHSTDPGPVPVGVSSEYIRGAGASAGAYTCALAGQNLGASHWLLAAALQGPQAIADWQDHGAAWLRPGNRFTAVTVQASAMHQAVGRPGPQECTPALAHFLNGPVFCRPGEFGPECGYTVLLPASAAGIWRVAVTVVLPRAAQFLVPAPDRLEPAADAPWWVVPPAGPDALCTPALLASLLARRTGAEDGQEASHV